MRSTTSLRNSVLCLVVLLLTVGCATFKPKGTLTPFPVEPNWKAYTSTPVSYDKTNKVYIITKEYMNNALLQGIYLDEIKIWKNENDIE